MQVGVWQPLHVEGLWSNELSALTSWQLLALLASLQNCLHLPVTALAISSSESWDQLHPQLVDSCPKPFVPGYSQHPQCRHSRPPGLKSKPSSSPQIQWLSSHGLWLSRQPSRLHRIFRPAHFARGLPQGCDEGPRHSSSSGPQSSRQRTPCPYPQSRQLGFQVVGTMTPPGT